MKSESEIAKEIIQKANDAWKAAKINQLSATFRPLDYIESEISAAIQLERQGDVYLKMLKREQLRIEIIKEIIRISPTRSDTTIEHQILEIQFKLDKFKQTYDVG
jgi:predicted transcriptional regulator